jgi:murein DD-endopeptidase MepM/ murein hydrolase activator NlpD
MPGRITVIPALALALLGATERPAGTATVPPPFSGPPSLPSSPAFGTYSWPVRGPVIRGFQLPNPPYGPGHRGIDIGAPLGTDVRAASDGVVAFAGWVAGALFVSIDHPDGVRTTYGWLSTVSVRKGEAVSRGQVVAKSGRGHPELPTPHLHFGARVGDTYLDPMLLLQGLDVADLIHLAPMRRPAGGAGRAPPRR